jgi:uncharacterized membrane protein YczE
MPLANLTPTEQLRAGRLSRRLVQLVLGLALYGASMAVMIRSGLGQLPWDVLHFGIARHVPLSFGQVVIVTSFAVLLLWVPLRQMPGLGTIANAVLIGIATDMTLSVLPAMGSLDAQLAFMVAGVAGNALATALYIGSQLGPGPRDGLMTGLARETDRSLRLIRTGLEVVAVALGWLLGGVVGIGTLAYAAAIGPLAQLLLPWCTVEISSALRGK